MPAGLAHGASLPIFSKMLAMQEEPSWKASYVLQNVLTEMSLREHVQVVIVVRDSGSEIGFESLSDFGSEVLRELLGRSEFPPCPVGQCEMDNGSCKWCGTPQA